MPSAEARVHVPERFKSSLPSSFVQVPYDSTDQVGDVKEGAVDMVRQLIGGEAFEYSSFCLGVYANGRLQKLLADNLVLSQISTYSAEGPSTLVLVYVKDIDKAKGKDPTWTFMSEEEKTKVREANTARFKLASDLLESEKTYVNQLSVIVDVFLVPLKQAKLLSAEELDILFGPIEHIYAIHSQFLDNLAERLKQWAPERHQPHNVFNMIGDLFLTLVPRLDVYATSSNYMEGLKLLTAHTEPKFLEFLRAAQANSRSGGMELTALLGFPMQRIPRYVMLLQEFISITLAFHQDYANLHFAAQLMNDAAVRIRDATDKRTQELELHKVAAELENKHIVRAGRSVLQKDKFALRQISNDRDKHYQVEETYALFLFNDSFIVAKKKSLSSKLKQITNVLLSAVSANTVAEGFALEIAPNLISVGEGGAPPMVLEFVVPHAEAEKWVQEIVKAKRRFLRRSPGPAHQEQQFLPPQNPSCARCNTAFNSDNRRLRCFTCSSAVCAECSKGRAKLNEDDVYKVRVCSWCMGAGNLRFKLVELEILEEKKSDMPEQELVFESLGVQFWQLKLEQSLKTKETLKVQLAAATSPKEQEDLSTQLGVCREKIDELVERLIAEKEYVDLAVHEVVKDHDGRLTLSPTMRSMPPPPEPLVVESAKSNARAEMLLAGSSLSSAPSAQKH